MFNSKFSIVVPVYNVFDMLERCVDSLTAQDYDSTMIEILLIDDGSTDGSGELCNSLAKKFENVSAYHKENGGLSDARNYGVEKATGNYIIFVDSDDYIEADTCSRFADNIGDNLPDIVAGGFVKHDNGKTQIYSRHNDYDRPMTGERFLLSELQNNTYFVVAVACAYKASFLNDNSLRFSPGILHEDEEFTPRAFLCAKSVKCIDSPFYHYIIRENSITTQKNKTRNAISIFKICNELYPLYDNLQNINLKKLLKSHSAKICFRMIEEARLYERTNRTIVDSQILKKCCIYPRERLRYMIYKISPKLLHLVTLIFARS